MAHADQVLRVLKEKSFPLEKIILSSQDKVYFNHKEGIYLNRLEDIQVPLKGDKISSDIKTFNYFLLSINSDKSMEDFKFRVNKASHTILYILDKSPLFLPAIRGTYFEIVKVFFIK